jgi:hypothetical protein
LVRRLVATLFLAGLVGGCHSGVPGSLTHAVNIGTGTLGPMPADKVPLVRLTAAEAQATVLAHERETGWPDPGIAWKGGGCVLLAWYERRPMSMAPVPPPPSAVYVVRVVSELDATKELWVMVEATTGELGAAFGGPSSSDCAAPAR